MKFFFVLKRRIFSFIYSCVNLNVAQIGFYCIRNIYKHIKAAGDLDP